MSTNKLIEIINLLAKVGVTDLSTKKALQMTLVLKQLDIHEIKGEKGDKIANILVAYEV